MCGMTRALICDPDMPARPREGPLDDIRACIACNQACIGHFQLGVRSPASSIRRPAASSPWAARAVCRSAAHPRGRRRAGRAEGRASQPSAGIALRSTRLRAAGRSGAAGAAAAGARRVRRHRHQSARELARAGVEVKLTRELIRRRSGRASGRRHHRHRRPAHRPTSGARRAHIRRCLGRSSRAGPMSAPPSSSPTGAATGSAWASPRGSHRAGGAARRQRHAWGQRLQTYVRDHWAGAFTSSASR